MALTKKIKEFLTNILTINSCKERMNEVLSHYNEGEDIRKVDLEILKENLIKIIACNKKNNTDCSEEIVCLEEIKSELQKLAVHEIS